MQNHDQVGNRAGGERSSRLMNAGRLRIAAALVLTSPFIPLLFQGEEWGATTPFLYFTDHRDGAMARAVREGRQREFAASGWNPEDIADPQARETFERSKLDWSELSHPAHADLLEWHRRLIELRQAEPSLTDGRMDRVQTRYDEAERWLVVQRGPILVACNLADDPRAIHLPAGRHRVLLASAPAESLENGTVTLPPDSVLVMKLDEAPAGPAS
jgi:maltooligosyltrehalose trehalohydrolase